MVDKNLLAAQLQDHGDDELEALAMLVSRESARRRMRDHVAPIVQVAPTIKTVLQADFLNVVGSPTGGYVEAEVTMDADGGIRLYTSSGGGGGGLVDGDYGDIVVSSSGTVILFDSAVVTAAAKTVLDDATVSAMVDTLGGSSSTGSGGLVRATSAALTTPNIGTPSAGTLTSCTGLPISTGVSGLGSGIATFLATPSSANLRSAVTDESGTGALLFASGAIGTPSSGTLTNCTGLPTAGLVNNAVTFAKLVAAGSSGFIGATAAGNYAHRSYSQVQSDLVLVPGTDIQPYSDDLQSIADCAPSDGDVLYYGSRSGWTALANPGSPSGGTTYVLTHDGSSPAWMEFPLP